MPDPNKELAKKVAELEKAVKELQGQAKAFEQKIKVLADNTLDSKGLDKFVTAHMATAQNTTDKQMEKDRKRAEELVELQGKKERSETRSEMDKMRKEIEKENQAMVDKAIAQHHKTQVDVRLLRLEALAKAR